MLPPWYGIFKAAREWGIAPWEIDPDTPRLIWYIRSHFIWNIRDDKRAKDLAKLEK
jgi:hypothetical protein